MFGVVRRKHWKALPFPADHPGGDKGDAEGHLILLNDVIIPQAQEIGRQPALEAWETIQLVSEVPM